MGILGGLLFWQITASIKLFNPIYFASLWEVLNEAVIMIRDGTIFKEMMVTIYRVFFSVLISALIGVPLAIVIGYFIQSYRLISKLVDFLRSIPPIVMYPLMLIMLGTGDASRIGVAVFGSVVVLVLIISKGLSQETLIRRLFNTAHGASRRQVIFHTVFFEAPPYIMVGLRTAVSLSIIVIVVTEMLVGAKYGLGIRIQNVQITNNIPDLFATIILIGLIGIGFNFMFAWFDNRFIFWCSKKS